MTMLDDLRARGLKVSVTKAGKLRVTPASKLTAADRATLREHGRALLALLALEAVFADQAAMDEADARATVAAADLRAQRENLRRKVDVMASWGEDKVAALAEAGKLTPTDIQLWRVVRGELLRRRYLDAMAGQLAERINRVARASTFRSGY